MTSFRGVMPLNACEPGSLAPVVRFDLAQPHSYRAMDDNAAEQFWRDVERRPGKEAPVQHVVVMSHHQAYLYITRPAGLVMYRQGW